MKKMLGGQKCTSDTEVSRFAVAWTAAQIVLCIGHSEACWQMWQMFEQTWTSAWTICW